MNCRCRACIKCREFIRIEDSHELQCLNADKQFEKDHSMHTLIVCDESEVISKFKEVTSNYCVSANSSPFCSLPEITQNTINEPQSINEIEASDVLVSQGDVSKFVKTEIDSWLEKQRLDLNLQAELREKLKEVFHYLCSECSLPQGSELYATLFSEVNEMLTLKFALNSLMDAVSDANQVIVN